MPEPKKHLMNQLNKPFWIELDDGWTQAAVGRYLMMYHHLKNGPYDRYIYIVSKVNRINENEFMMQKLAASWNSSLGVAKMEMARIVRNALYRDANGLELEVIGEERFNAAEAAESAEQPGPDGQADGGDPHCDVSGSGGDRDGAGASHDPPDKVPVRGE